ALGYTSPQNATPECISDFTSLAENVSRKSVNFRLVSRYVLYLSGSVFFATITPSFTDQRSEYPSQPSSDFPSNSLIVSVLPSRGLTIGASLDLGLSFLSWASARPTPSSTSSAAAIRMTGVPRAYRGATKADHTTQPQDSHVAGPRWSTRGVTTDG